MTGGQPKQARLVDCLSSNKRAAIMRKRRGGNVGKYARNKANKKALSENEHLIIKLRHELRPSHEIAKRIGVHPSVVTRFINQHFNGDDPYATHIVESFNAGESVKGIGKRLQVQTSSVSRYLKLAGINSWEKYKEKCETSGRARSSVRTLARPTMAEDLHCLLKDHDSIRNLADYTGFHETQIGLLFAKYIHGYKSQSMARREKAPSLSLEKYYRVQSNEFRFESDFNVHCRELLAEYRCVSTLAAARSPCPLEIDLLVVGKRHDVLIELKVTAKKKELARATGQLLIQSVYYKRDHSLIACFPDDVHIDDEIVTAMASLGVTVCCASQLASTVDGLIHKSKGTSSHPGLQGSRRLEPCLD